MSPARFRNSCAVAWLVLGFGLLLSACGSGDPTNLQFGGLRIDSITSGANPDENAYSVQVTGPSLNVEQTIGLNDQIVFTVTPGSYSARLTNVANNCAVDVNPFNVIVAAGATAQVTFRVTCS